MTAIANSIYRAAEVYTDFVETAGNLTYYGADASVSCLDAIFTTTTQGWTRGLKDSAKECAKYSLGFYDYKKAVEVFRKKDPVAIPNANGAFVTDNHPFPRRLGESAGHVINGGCKGIATGVFAVGTGAYIWGNISNSIDWTQAGTFGDFHIASRLLAKGVNAFAKCMFGFSVSAAKVGLSAAKVGAQIVIENPGAVFNGVGIGGTLYLSSRNIVKAGKADASVRKAIHISFAVLSLGATLLVPYINPFRKIS